MSIEAAPGLVALFARLGVSVAAFEAVAPADPDALFADERAQTVSMGPSRLVEFTGGRLCARAALVASGFAGAPLLKTESRVPDWPAGSTGSISHSHGYCVAAAGQFDHHHIGIDAEAIGRVGTNLWNRLFTDEEQQRLGALSGDEAELAATAMFSVKEAYYKAQFPITGAWVSFRDVHVDYESNTTDLTLRRATDLDALDAVQWPVAGVFGREDDMILSAVAVSPAAPLTPEAPRESNPRESNPGSVRRPSKPQVRRAPPA